MRSRLPRSTRMAMVLSAAQVPQCQPCKVCVVVDGALIVCVDAPAQVSPAPTTSNVQQTSVTVSWSQPYNSGSPITGYSIFMQTGGSGSFSTLVANTASSALSYSVTGLTAATVYSFRCEYGNVSKFILRRHRLLPSMPSAPDKPARPVLMCRLWLRAHQLKFHQPRAPAVSPRHR
jgi:hypothetical protein